MSHLKKATGLTFRARFAVVLATVIGLTVFLLPGSLLGIEVLSANAATPCPGPVTPTASTVAFINPSTGMTATSQLNMTGTPEVSAKPKTPGGTDPEAATYHINSWGANLPPNPLVQYFYYPTGGTDPATPIGFATRAGTDAFEYFWQSSSMPADGAYTLCAVLSNLDTTTQTATPVAQATQDVNVNNQDGDPTNPTSDQDARGDTVEITYPTNSGLLGAYTPPNPTSASPAPPSNFIMDVKVSPGSMPPDGGTVYVKGFYSLTPPGGSEPTWKSCTGYAKVTQGKVNNLLCTLAAGDSPSSINAVGALANDTPSQFPSAQPQFDDSTDGHRVATHITQVPTQVSLNPSSVIVGKDSNGALPCRPVTATVTDQESPARPIAKVNVDVHATGPTNSIRFDIVDTASGAPQNHLQDPAYDCKNGGNSGVEGDHVGAGGGGLDTKHIESTSGTTASGTYVFELHSDDIGTTSLSAWADTDDDDVAGPSDPVAAGSITWATTAPSSTTPTPTASPSTSPTASTSPTTPSPSTSSSSPGTVFTVITDLSIAYSNGDFHGRAKAGTSQCRTGRSVTIKKSRRGPDKTLAVEVTKGQRGKYRLHFPSAHGHFYAKVSRKVYFDQQGNEYDCRADRSPTIKT
ncbi:MAG: hypothetical protein QOC87_496 [Actinomycetota bacterium]|nr:hypothetical protein [Actinomycetota bacterium]